MTSAGEGDRFFKVRRSERIVAKSAGKIAQTAQRTPNRGRVVRLPTELKAALEELEGPGLFPARLGDVP